MSCCSLTTKTFSAATSTNVAFLASGPKPKVKVYYLIDGVWHAAGIVTRIDITPGLVNVDHGGPATGIIQLLT